MQLNREQMLDRLSDARSVYQRFGSQDRQRVVIPENLLSEILPTDIPQGVILCVGGTAEDHFAALEVYNWGYFFVDDQQLFGICVLSHLPEEVWDRSLAFPQYVDLVRRKVENCARNDANIALLPSRGRSIGGEEFVPRHEELTVRFSVRCNAGTLPEADTECRRIYGEIIAEAEEATDKTDKIVLGIANSISQLQDWDFSEVLRRISSVGANEKGQALEELLCRLFAGIDGLSVSGRRRTSTEEIDISIINASANARLSREGPVIVVECKNWSSKCGKNEVVLLRDKMRNRGRRCTLAFLVSWNGFAKTVTSEMLRSSREEFLIVPITGKQILEAVKQRNFTDIVFNAWDKAVFT